MAKVDIYTTRFCPFCIRAKALLDKLNIAYHEISVDGDAPLRAKMEALTGGYTVPQILINDKPIGGCDDLHALHANGQLLPMIK